MVMTERYGYYKSHDIPPSNGHPEMNDYKLGDKLLVAKFDDYSYNQLSKKAFQNKMEELFSEPSSYEDENDDWIWLDESIFDFKDLLVCWPVYAIEFGKEFLFIQGFINLR